MSARWLTVPHLDARLVDGKPTLFFGPYAGFSPKFLKFGSFLDLFRSIRPHNIVPMLQVGARNIGLTRYLIGEVLASSGVKFSQLRKFYPAAHEGDWEQVTAGQRVQVIRPDGTLQFGTEVIVSGDRTMTGLLGASPGASVAVSVMIDLLERSFPERIAEWGSTLSNIVPSYRLDPHVNPEGFTDDTTLARKRLGLGDVSKIG